MSNKLFDTIRFLAETGISAIGAFYLAIAEIWGLPYGKAVSATALALSTLVGIFCGVSRQNYNDNFGEQTTFDYDPDEPDEEE